MRLTSHLDKHEHFTIKKLSVGTASVLVAITLGGGLIHADTPPTTATSSSATSQSSTDASSSAVRQSSTDASSSAASQSSTDASSSTASQSSTDASSSAVRQSSTDASSSAASQSSTDASSSAASQSSTDASSSAASQSSTDASSSAASQSSSDVASTPQITSNEQTAKTAAAALNKTKDVKLSPTYKKDNLSGSNTAKTTTKKLSAADKKLVDEAAYGRTAWQPGDGTWVQKVSVAKDGTTQWLIQVERSQILVYDKTSGVTAVSVPKFALVLSGDQQVVSVGLGKYWTGDSIYYDYEAYRQKQERQGKTSISYDEYVAQFFSDYRKDQTTDITANYQAATNGSFQALPRAAAGTMANEVSVTSGTTAIQEFNLSSQWDKNLLSSFGSGKAIVFDPWYNQTPSATVNSGDDFDYTITIKLVTKVDPSKAGSATGVMLAQNDYTSVFKYFFSKNDDAMSAYLNQSTYQLADDTVAMPSQVGGDSCQLMLW